MQCINIHGYEHRNFGLMVVNLPPHINSKSQVIKAPKKSKTILECNVIAAPKPDVKWIKSNNLLNVTFDSENIEKGDYSLVSVNMTKLD
ncbi:hypothetical protein B4U80_05678 [Leptotrombidium deliense]|uniref:Immunoglobulin I-set domain-containing protein n=1 Tax=Leptotrombidium deliense TaxID=299467 RepID=A0A443RW62_9ACAR|nr:hypothetical protein B4U80_05678 [Leptotrombidium deliense]